MSPDAFRGKTGASPFRVLVVNAGTHPEPAHLAAGLLAAGAELIYVTSASWPSSSPIVRLARSPLGRRIPIVRDFSRRALPAGLQGRTVKRLAGGAEVGFQIVRAFASSRYRSALNWRTKRFRRSVAAHLNRWPTFDAVVAQQTGALEAFENARGAVRILSYPIAHHRWMLREMAEEAARNPRWAGSLQGNDRTPDELSVLDQEIELADIVLVGSNFVKRTFIEQGVDEEKIRVLGLGANVDELGPVLGRRVDNTADGSAFKVLFAGQLTQRKGLSYLIDGFLEADVPHSSLTLVGAPVGDALDRIPVRQDINIRASVPRSELGAMFAQADVLVLPSLAEGFPLVAIEAMSCGTPCVVSTSTFADDVITSWHDGVIVKPADASAIAAGLRRLASDRSLLERMSSAARIRAAEYTWERYSKASADLVFEILREHRSPHDTRGHRL